MAYTYKEEIKKYEEEINRMEAQNQDYRDFIAKHPECIVP